MRSRTQHEAARCIGTGIYHAVDPGRSIKGMSQMSKSSKSLGRHSFMILSHCCQNRRQILCTTCRPKKETTAWVNSLLMSRMMGINQCIFSFIKNSDQGDVVTLRTVGRLLQWLAHINVSQAYRTCVRGSCKRVMLLGRNPHTWNNSNELMYLRLPVLKHLRLIFWPQLE